MHEDTRMQNWGGCDYMDALQTGVCRGVGGVVKCSAIITSKCLIRLHNCSAAMLAVL